ncbi:MAG: hypothetical protein J7623_18245 [Chitinophaga sp.]|uniref:hypothetical protein n=1 Tax=Chitinophaga sp. TaxID=1869181 RepID=UPI001B2C6695|nr:hypothetical protein [Chitinophaga sp.]MBO9730589.1 hypothetical protein [Chitinophaga sp.]
MFRLYTLVCAGCLLFFLKDASAQSRLFSHAIGGGLFAGNSYLGAGLVYSPRLNFLRFSDHSVLALSTHIGVGTTINDNYNSNTGGNSTSIFMANMPVLVTWNFGNAATRRAYTKWGFFTGAGYGFHNATHGVEFIDDEEVSSNQIHVSGMVLSAGINFPIANSSFGIRVAHLFNNNQYNPDIAGITTIGIDYNIGVKFNKR